MSKRLVITKLQVLRDIDQIQHQFIFSNGKAFVIDNENALGLYYKIPERSNRKRRRDIPFRYLLLIHKYYRNNPDRLDELSGPEPVKTFNLATFLLRAFIETFFWGA
ncbi:hypothetical protein FWG95_00085 [Candidatus Saccharibacteria bacterium]|nr:hypothetical protein [Candidatus Saccharibacteria bacterium]